MYLYIANSSGRKILSNCFLLRVLKMFFVFHFQKEVHIFTPALDGLEIWAWADAVIVSHWRQIKRKRKKF
jgi:hypothetical protein